MWKNKIKKLNAIYNRFEEDVREYKKDAICKLGCTYCCTDVGNVDINTLEGMVIRERVNSFDAAEKKQIKKKLTDNKKQKEASKIARCPFLKKEGACLIYDIRPFSCRQLYSLQECAGKGPMVHKQAKALAKKAVRDMQQLDDTGYSGHLSFIYHLLEKDAFRKLYIKGGFDPGKIMAFGKSHGIIINGYIR